jgi:DNA-binding beta-propeller fold protein YncE
MRLRLPILLLAAAVLVPAAATAAPYDLELQDCIETTGTPPCTGADDMLRAHDVAVSPDGRNVYVVGAGNITDPRRPPDGRIAVYARAADGSLRFMSCFSDRGGRGCADAPLPALFGATSVAVSPDGRSVYVAATGHYDAAHSGALLTFDRGAGGGVTFSSCVGDGTADGCASGKAALGMTLPSVVAVSPAGDRVVVGGGNETSSIVDFRRDADGDPSWAGCVGSANPACREASELLGVRGLAFSADGRDLYAASNDDWNFVPRRGVIAHLLRDDTGTLDIADCVGSSGGRCRTTSDHIAGASGIVVTPDDGEVFVAAWEAGAVTRFLRGPSGRLSEFGCAGGEVGGCTRIGTAGFGTGDVAASPDGSGVYGLNNDPRLFTFARNSAESGLRPVRCDPTFPGRYGERLGCDGYGSGGQSLGLAFSPDGQNLYAASPSGYSHTLAIYRRSTARPETTVSPGAGMPIRPPGMGGIGMLRGRMQFTLDKAATVTITLSRVLPGRLVRGRCVARTRSNAWRRACTRLKKAGKVVRNGVAGKNSVSLPKGLLDGRYRATLIAVAGGQRSDAKTTSFTIG